MTLEQRKAISKRNYPLMILEGSLFWAAMAILDPNAVISVFVNEFTGNVQMAGFAATARLATTIIGQFLMGMVAYRIHDHGKFLKKFAVWARMPYWLLLPVLFMGYSGPGVVMWFVFLYSAFFFMDGFVSISWYEINAHTIPPEKRGPLAGYQQFFAALVGLASAVAIKLLMDSPLEPPIRYGCIFALAAIACLFNTFVLRSLKDIPPENVQSRPKSQSFTSYIKAFLPLWISSLHFRQIIFARLLYTAGVMASALLVLFGRKNGNLTDTQVSTMIYLQVGGQLTGGILWGQMSRRLGNVRIIQCSQLLSVIIGGMGIAVFLTAQTASMFLPCAIMVFLSGLQNSSYHGYNSIMIDLMPQESLSHYVVMQSLLLLPLSAAPFLAGLIVDYSSFLPVFILVALFGLAGIIQSISLEKILPKFEKR